MAYLNNFFYVLSFRMKCLINMDLFEAHVSSFCIKCESYSRFFNFQLSVAGLTAAQLEVFFSSDYL